MKVILTLIAITASHPLFQANRIPAGRALECVRAFVHNPAVTGTVIGPRYQPVFLYDYYYTVETHAPEEASFDVHARTGDVLSATFNVPELNEPPRISIKAAEEIAVRYAREHYLPFNHGKWQRGPDKYVINGGRLVFTWSEVLNRFGVLAPHWLTVVVDGATGRIVNFGVPFSRIAGPTIPRLTLGQAKTIASRWTTIDPLKHPFDEIELRLTEDRFGIQRLLWVLYQNEDRNANDPTPKSGVFLDAITGNVTGVRAPSSSLSGARSVRSLPHLAVPKYRIETSDGKLLQLSVPPEMKEGALWARVELFRGLGAIVTAMREKAEIEAGGRTVMGQRVGAKWTDYGWWVPVKAVARALGQRVEWREQAVAIIYSPAGG